MLAVMLPRYLRFAQALTLPLHVGVLVSAAGCGGTVISSPTGGDGGVQNDAAVRVDADFDGDLDDGDIVFPDDAVVVEDSMVVRETALPADTSPPSDSSTTGTCKDWGMGIACASPNVCAYGWGGSVPDSGGEPSGPYCGPPPDGGTVTPCGAIGCAQPCWCESAVTSTCSCQIAVGPLPPPDLPAS